MKNIFKYKTLFFAILLCVGLLSGCKDDESLGNADRLFRPIMHDGSYGGTWIKLNWDRYTGAKKYELELSVDSFKTVLATGKTDSISYTFTNLNFDTKYQVRLRSIGDITLTSGDTIKSAYYVTPDVTTLDYPTKLITPTVLDVIDNSIRVKWDISTSVYTQIKVLLDKATEYKTVTLTAADNLAGTKIIGGLQPQTSYIVKIYQGDAYMGKKTFTTASSQVFTGDVVDLRNFTDDQSKNIITQSFVDSISTAHPDGLNLVLSGGTTYNIGTILVPVNINFITGLSFKGKAIMAIDGNFATPPAKTVGTLRFEKIFFTEGATKLKTAGNFGGTYLFNFNQTGAILDKMILENCDIKYKRGAIRMQTTATINQISINNCLFDSIGDYGIVNNANDASYIKDIIVKNSTVAHAAKLFTCGKKLGINSLTIENLTSCYSPTSTANYFLDYNTNTVPGGISIKNSLFGAASGVSTNGMRSSCSNISITNCFRTSDLVWTLGADGVTQTAPINDFADFGKTTVQIFTDPTKSNFKVSDAKLVNKIGDPRWW